MKFSKRVAPSNFRLPRKELITKFTKCVFRTFTVPLLGPQIVTDGRKYGMQVEASHDTEYLDIIFALLLGIRSTCVCDFPLSKLFMSDVFQTLEKVVI
jgi:hypothetical protein